MKEGKIVGLGLQQTKENPAYNIERSVVCMPIKRASITHMLRELLAIRKGTKSLSASLGNVRLEMEEYSRARVC